MDKEFDMYEQSIDDYCPVMAFLDGEEVRFQQDTQKWVISPNSEFEFIYRLDLGSARIDGPLLGRKVKLTIGHSKYNDMCNKTLEFQWINGQWRLVGWNPSGMTFPDLEKESFIVPEVIQDSLTNAVRKLGKKLCQDFSFLNETPQEEPNTKDQQEPSQFQKKRVGNIPPKDNDNNQFSQYLKDRRNTIETCADELLQGIDCDDEEMEDKLGEYFEKVLEKYM